MPSPPEWAALAGVLGRLRRYAPAMDGGNW